jgi:DNA recombination protein RmuC
MQFISVFVLGAVFGAAIVLLFNWLRRETLTKGMKESFSSLSFEVLSRSTQEFLKLAEGTFSKHTDLGKKELEGKKELIDQTLVTMKGDLEKVRNLVTSFEKDREQKFGELTSQLKSTAEQTTRLQQTTDQLRSALASTKARGQWGERMAEDVLRLAGFVEGINYQKQKAIETVGTRPDYTFLLPQDLKVNMDVKSPLDNYLRYLEVDGETDKEAYRIQFLRDVRARIKEVTTRDYINPEENTLDYAIVFIPNESVYAFIHENDCSVLDDALKNKVILCSPVTLYAILALIRQAVDNFNLERTAAQILSLLGTFHKQWDAFVKSFDKMGKKIEEAQLEFNNLTSTRRNKLETPLRRIEDLRRQRGIPEESLIEEEITFIEGGAEADDKL